MSQLFGLALGIGANLCGNSRTFADLEGFGWRETFADLEELSVVIWHMINFR